MIIENMIQTDEIERIKEVISKLQMVGCIDTFKKYIIQCHDNIKTLSSVEKAFYDNLYAGLYDLICEIIMLNTTIEDTHKILRDYVANGFWGLADRELDEMLDMMFVKTDKECYSLIKKYMKHAISKVIEDSNKVTLSAKEKEIENIKKAIEENLKGIESLKQKLEVLEA